MDIPRSDEEILHLDRDKNLKLYAFVKTPQTVHSASGHFTIFILCLHFQEIKMGGNFSNEEVQIVSTSYVSRHNLIMDF